MPYADYLKENESCHTPVKLALLYVYRLCIVNDDLHVVDTEVEA